MMRQYDVFLDDKKVFPTIFDTSSVILLFYEIQS